MDSGPEGLEQCGRRFLGEFDYVSLAWEVCLTFS